MIGVRRTPARTGHRLAAAAGFVALAAGVAPAPSAPTATPQPAVTGAECSRVYLVHRAGSPLPRIDGVLDEDEWPEPRWETDLSFAWRPRAAPETAFAVVSDGGDLLFAFRVLDRDVVVAPGDPADESRVERGDRAELFLARDRELSEYFAIEIDPRGRVLDYRGRFYRRFEKEWDCPGLEVAAGPRPDGYAVEGRIPRAALREMGLGVPSGSSVLLAGAFRAEFSRRANGPPDESWISWVRPQVSEPDFHVPSAFGCFRAAEEP